MWSINPRDYPDDLPAAVDTEQSRFVGKEKDRANFKQGILQSQYGDVFESVCAGGGAH